MKFLTTTGTLGSGLVVTGKHDLRKVKAQSAQVPGAGRSGLRRSGARAYRAAARPAAGARGWGTVRAAGPGAGELARGQAGRLTSGRCRGPRGPCVFKEVPD